jgi:hypothetical protein
VGRRIESEDDIRVMEKGYQSTLIRPRAFTLPVSTAGNRDVWLFLTKSRAKFCLLCIHWKRNALAPH